MDDDERAVLATRLAKNRERMQASLNRRSAAVEACEDIPNPAAIPDVIAACRAWLAHYIISDDPPNLFAEKTAAALAKLEETENER